MQSADFNQLSLPSFKSLFAHLLPPQSSELKGIYQAEFVGPFWLRKTAGPFLALASFKGWWGKQFGGVEQGVNLFFRSGKLLALHPFTLTIMPSLVDDKPSVVIRYAPNAPFPWYFAQDELRWFDDARTMLLGLTILNKGILRRLAFPFLLHPCDDIHDV